MNTTLSCQRTAVVVLLLAVVATTNNRYGLSAELATTLRELDANVLSETERKQYSGMVARDIERRRLQAIQRENKAWAAVDSRDKWERFRDQRMRALRKSLGEFPPVPKHLKITTTGRIKGDGYQIQNIVYESRPGLFVTANLYLPSKPKKSMPALLFSHSHHAPKTQGELQDMGMTWARQGWVVLVVDHLGHGERRQHPFVSGKDFPKSFRVSRQDYYFRHNVGLQLKLVGESLMGWMVWDLMRGVDLLCARDDVDKDRIILIGAVAGGGDPAGVAAALDSRIAAVAPFNFGGPQPDYAIPVNAIDEFYYFGVAYWETTRCLRLGGRDGFAHWTIVGSVAPRRLIYSSEFGWDREHDPVWPRLEKVFGFYDAKHHLDIATGRGHLKGRPPESTHCSNVGVFHRRKIYPHLQRWFDMDSPSKEFQQRRETKELMCLTPAAIKKLNPQPVYSLAGKLGVERSSAARRHRQSLSVVDRRKRLCDAWSQRLGNVTPENTPMAIRSWEKVIGKTLIQQVLLEVQQGIVVPMVVIRAESNKRKDAPVVLLVAQAGKQQLLAERSREIAVLISGGAIVCLPDLRGTGETRSGNTVGPRSSATTLSCREQVLGQTVLGSRLRDLRSVLLYVREEHSGPLAIWGDSLALVNPRNRDEVVPHGIENPNIQAHPSGGILALLVALVEDDVNAVCASGTLASFASLLDNPFLYVPHDTVVPGVLTASEISDVAAAIAPRPLMMKNLIDGLNRSVSTSDVLSTFAQTTQAYQNAKSADRLALPGKGEKETAAWLLAQLKR